MVMCIFLFLLWLILNGKVTLEICLFGVVITGGSDEGNLSADGRRGS